MNTCAMVLFQISYKKNQDKCNHLYLLTTMIRIYQGIEYLHSKSLIYRDLKPGNILIDHDYLPYICDLDTIRNPSTEDKPMTFDICSNLYASPEQWNGREVVSYPTDIYSFGLIVYYLYEKKDMRKDNNILNESEHFKIHPMSNVPLNVEEFYEKCIQVSQEKRPKTKEIRSLLIDVVNSVCSFYNSDIFDITEIIFFLNEFLILIQNDNHDDLNRLARILSHFKSLLLNKENNSSIQSDSNSLLTIGCLYENGNEGLEQDYQKAKEYYELSASLKNSSAFLHLGNLYFNGNGVDQNYEKAIECYESSAELNNLMSLSILATFYCYGFFVKKNYQKAMNYYKKLVDLGDLYSLFKIGTFYENGYDVIQDYNKAAEYYQSAALFNDSRALLFLGNLCFNGHGLSKDYEKAKNYYKSSNELQINDPNDFIIIYSKFDNFKEKYLQLKDLFVLSIFQKCPKLFSVLNTLYYNEFLYKQNYTEAIKYFEILAEHKNADAIFKLGEIYENGFGVNKDYSKAMEYYEMLTEQNNSEAFLKLGIFYENDYVVLDYIKAQENYEKSANLNNAEALFRLGEFYKSNKYVPIDYSKSIYYYKLAAVRKHSFALLNLGEIE